MSQVVDDATVETMCLLERETWPCVIWMLGGFIFGDVHFMRLMDGVIRARLTVFSDCDYASQDHTRRKPDTTGRRRTDRKLFHKYYRSIYTQKSSPFTKAPFHGVRILPNGNAPTNRFHMCRCWLPSTTYPLFPYGCLMRGGKSFTIPGNVLAAGLGRGATRPGGIACAAGRVRSGGALARLTSTFGRILAKPVCVSLMYKVFWLSGQVPT